MTEIVQAERPEELTHTRDLMRAFVSWHRERHLEDHELIDGYFDSKAFEDELASLPGKYGPPRGRLLLATYDGEPAGCVALREVDVESCEMKRMFVYPRFQGKKIGRALADAVLNEARAIGYTRMLLDTSFRQTEARRLYESLGFRRTEPYYDLPKELTDWLVFMELQL